MARAAHAVSRQLDHGSWEFLSLTPDLPDVTFACQDLVTRNQDDALTPTERADLESYLQVSSFLDLMHAKARRSLKKHH
jgi:hypothetical protein